MAKHSPLRSYAEAYVSSLTKKSDGVGELCIFQYAISRHPEIRSFLSDTSISKEDRMNALKLIHPSAEEETLSFVRILGEDGILERFDCVIEQVRKSYKKLTDFEYVRVTSAVDLTNEEQKRIKKAIAKEPEREIRLELNIDPGIIGGLIIQQNDSIFNASVKGRLDQLKRLLNV
jgi:F-type H+-transporting ATPase subunit delta